MEISSENYQMMASHSLEDVLEGCTKAQQQQHQEKKPRPHPETALKCPRCDSTNTKFCYYNNYSLSQPRYFCKGCRRYWTQGGSLRNVPVGGGCRKNKKSSNSSSKRSHHQDPALLTTNPNKLLTTLPLPPPPPPPSLSYDAHDLTLAFATNRHFGLDDHDSFLMGNPNPSSSSCIATIHTNNTGYLDILRNAGLPNVYYGYGGPGNVEGMDGYVGLDAGLLGSSVATANTVTTASGSTTPSQDSCRGLEGGESSKVLMGLQWQLGGDGNMGLDSGRECWNGVGSSWHGFTNSTFI